MPANGGQASLAAWTSPTAMLAGFLFIAACGYLAAVYLAGEAQRRGDARLRAYFTRRGQAAAIVAGALSLAALAELHTASPLLYHRLTGRAVALVVAAGLRGLAALILLTARRMAAARVTAALGVAAVVWGWGVAQYPVLLPGTAVTLSSAGAPDNTMVALVVLLFVVAAALIGPSFALLFALQGRRLLGAGEGGAVPVAVAAGLPERPAAARGQPAAGNSPLTRPAVLALVLLMALVRRLRRR